MDYLWIKVRLDMRKSLYWLDKYNYFYIAIIYGFADNER